MRALSKSTAQCIQVALVLMLLLPLVSLPLGTAELSPQTEGHHLKGITPMVSSNASSCLPNCWITSRHRKHFSSVVIKSSAS